MKRFILPMALAGLFFVGCKPAGPSLEGTWSMDGDALKGAPGAKGTMTFSGKNMELKMTMGDAQVGEMTITAKGTYTLEGEKYDHKIDSVKLDTSKVNEAVRKLVESQFKEEDMKKQMSENAKSTIKFVDDKTVEMTSGTGKLTLKKS